MKKMKKGFTIVELVIVIAVIAILAAVLIPTFTSVTEKAKESAALQEARNAQTLIIVHDTNEQDDTKDIGVNYIIEVDGYKFKVENGQLKTNPVDSTSGYTEITDLSAITGLPDDVKVYQKNS